MVRKGKFLQFSSFYYSIQTNIQVNKFSKNKMTKQLQQSFYASQSIASLALEQSIIHKTLLHCMPKQYVYEDSCRKAQIIENSIINLYSSQPDSEANNIRDIKDFKKNPTSFKVKQLKRQPSLIKQRTKPRRCKPSILRSNSIKYSNTEGDGRQKQIVAQLKSHGTVSYHESSQPFYPFDDRVRDRSKLVRLTTNQSEKQNNMQLIKIFRQNLFIKPHYFQDFDMQKSELSDSSVSTKKIKDVNKKIFALNTDYSGAWVQINRNDIKKQVSHFIQMETEVIEEPKEQEIPKKQQIRITSNSDYTNYKELKIVENQNNFATNILKKIKVKGQDKNQPEIGSSSVMKNMELYINSGKMIGRKVKPAKVGFHVFQQMKNSCNLTELQKSQQNMKKQQLRVKTSASHHEDIASRQKLGQHTRDTGSRLSKKCVDKTPNIIVKNSSAMNYLLSENTRGYKKKVTIVQNCI